MPIQLIAPLYEDFELEQADERYENEGEPSKVTIKQAAQWEHERRQKQFATLERKYNDKEPDEVTVIQNIPMEEIKKFETWLTLCECNILGPDEKALFPSKKDKDDHPRLSMTKAQFEKAWGTLPPDIATEIHDKVLEVNIVWSGRSGEES